jgi:hypothetical protein
VRVLTRAFVGCGLAVVAVPSVLIASAGAESAQSAKPAVLQSNWFWHQATSDQLAGSPAQGAVPEPSGVPAGDLALAITDPSSGSVSKEPYIAFDLSAVTAGSSIGEFTFTLPLDPSATQMSAETIPLKACLPTRLWTNNPDGGTDWSQKPEDDCSTSVKGTYDAAKQAYTFAVPTYAQGWLSDTNTGVAILPDGYTNPFQIAFSGPKAITATMTWTPAPLTSGPATTGQTSSVPVAAGAAAPAPAPAAAPISLPAPAPVTLPGSTTSMPAPAAQSPVLAAPSQAPAGVFTPLPVLKSASSAPTPGFWLAGGVLALLLLTVSLVLGDAEWAFTTGVRTSRLDQLLRARASRDAATTGLIHKPSSTPKLA